MISVAYPNDTPRILKLDNISVRLRVVKEGLRLRVRLRVSWSEVTTNRVGQRINAFAQLLMPDLRVSTFSRRRPIFIGT